MPNDQLKKKIFEIDSEEKFNDLSLAIYACQSKNIPIYKEWIERLNFSSPKHYKEIPFLPISFFKTQVIVDHLENVKTTFMSSGTTQQIRSKHFVTDLQLYEKSFIASFNLFFGDPSDWVILALLPNYLEQGASSLVYMVDHLIQLSQSPLSGFYLNEASRIEGVYQMAQKEGKKTMIFGVSYALMDLAEMQIDLQNALIIETGGMKGRRKEMDKAGLHAFLSNGLNGPQISSEYGMTELLSQGYSLEHGIFQTPPWMKILLRETNDPFSLVHELGKTGGINVIDLANIHSCAFIATEDLGKLEPNGGFTIQGRFDHADVRGCNLMVF